MSNTQRRDINGNVVWYNGHKKLLLDAIGPDVIKFSEDFVSPVASSDAIPGWTVTLVEGGSGETTVTVPDGSGGTLVILSDDAENDGANVQKTGENFGFSTSQSATYFGIRFKVSEKTQSDFLVGLTVSDTDALGGVTDGIYFRKVDGSSNVAAVTEKDSSETSSSAVTVAVNDTFVVYEFYVDSSGAYFFVDGEQVAHQTATDDTPANIPDDEQLSPVINFLSGSAGAKSMTVDWVRVIQVGRG